MKNKLFATFISVTTIFMSCNSSSNNNQAATKEIIKTADLINTDVPSILTEDSLIQKHLATQYWKKFPFNDTSVVNSNFEEALSIYLNILPKVSNETVEKAQHNLTIKAMINADSYRKVYNQLEHYLYDPNSPYRSEDMFKPILDHVIASNVFSDDEKIRVEYNLNDIHKNEVGSKATNFNLRTIDNKNISLHNVQSEYIILFFNNPDCHTCTEIKSELSKDALISEAIRQSKLQVLAIYADEDIDTWKKHVADYPKTWINAHDPKQDIKNKDLYNLRAIPCLYLLSADKTVLLKDCSLQQLLYYLSNTLRIE